MLRILWTPHIIGIILAGVYLPVEAWQTAETTDSNLEFLSHWEKYSDSRLEIIHDGKTVSGTQTEHGHYATISIIVRTIYETFILDLKLNTYLLSSSYIEKEVTDSGDIYNDVNHTRTHCYYIGQVRDKIQSTAAVSTCERITGYFSIGKVSYSIEVIDDEPSTGHRIFRNRDGTGALDQPRCGTSHQLRWVGDVTKNSSNSNRRLRRSFNWPQDLDKQNKVVEVYVANDYSQFTNKGSNVNTIYQRTKDIVNIASTLYQPLDIYLVLVGIEVWTQSNQFQIVDANVSAALNSWYSYRQNNVNPQHYNDNGVLITNVAFYGGVVGKAIIGSMCTNQYSGSVISDLNSRTAVVASTMAHEMGHNFGFQHDDGCSCGTSDNKCIMNAYSNPSSPATKWSTCSMNQLASSLSQGLDICLYNVPQTIYDASSSTCGNGIVENGEQCDCGNAPSNECSNTCCNSTTCRFQGQATCSTGKCCDIGRCQIKSSGVVCRSAVSGDCDFTEYCNGVDFLCPADSYQPDGTSCTNMDQAYCYGGRCKSHRSQCELLWGPGTAVSPSNCYSYFNVAGAHYGNCGYTWTSTGISYIRCATSDIMCGKLQCQDNTKNLNYYQNYYLLSTASIGSDSCHSAIFDFGLQTQDPGLVPNGAKCSDNKMCVNQRCVDVVISPVTSTSTSTTTTTTSTSTTTTTRKPSTSTSPVRRSTIPMSKTTLAMRGNSLDAFDPSMAGHGPGDQSTTTATESADNFTADAAANPEERKSHPLSGMQIGLIAGLTSAGVVVVVVFLIIIFVVGYRRRRSHGINTCIRKTLFHNRSSIMKPATAYNNEGFTSNEQKASGYEPLSPARLAPLPPTLAYTSSYPVASANDVYSNSTQAAQHGTPRYTDDFPPSRNESVYSNDGGVKPAVVSPAPAPVPPPKPASLAVYDNYRQNADNSSENQDSGVPKTPVKPPISNVSGSNPALDVDFRPSLLTSRVPVKSIMPNSDAFQPAGNKPQPVPVQLPPKPKVFPTEQPKSNGVKTDIQKTNDDDKEAEDEVHTLSVQELRRQFGETKAKPKFNAPKNPKTATNRHTSTHV